MFAFRKVANLFVMTAVLMVPARHAQAALISFGGGLIYDDVQDLTWLDTSYVSPPHTSMTGQDCPYFACDWYHTYWGATSWVADLQYEGYDDWRLPRRIGPGGFGDNEIHKMLVQLDGWEFGPELGDSFVLYAAGDLGPFAAPPPYHFVWMDGEPYIYTSPSMGYDFPDNFTSPANVFAVREGAPVSNVPEPSTLALVGFGVLAVAGVRRRRSWY